MNDVAICMRSAHNLKTWRRVPSKRRVGSASSSIAATGTNEQTVYVKWFFEQVVCSEGVNIYRQKKGETNWEKINNVPYKYIRPISNEDHKKDPSLIEYTEIIDETPSKELTISSISVRRDT